MRGNQCGPQQPGPPTDRIATRRCQPHPPKKRPQRPAKFLHPTAQCSHTSCCLCRGAAGRSSQAVPDGCDRSEIVDFGIRNPSFFLQRMLHRARWADPNKGTALARSAIQKSHHSTLSGGIGRSGTPARCFRPLCQSCSGQMEYLVGRPRHDALGHCKRVFFFLQRMLHRARWADPNKGTALAKIPS